MPSSGHKRSRARRFAEFTAGACAAPALIGGAASAQEFPIQSIKIIA